MIACSGCSRAAFASVGSRGTPRDAWVMAIHLRIHAAWGLFLNRLDTDSDVGIAESLVLAPSLVTDPNGNRQAVAFDTLGMVESGDGRCG